MNNDFLLAKIETMVITSQGRIEIDRKSAHAICCIFFKGVDDDDVHSRADRKLHHSQIVIAGERVANNT